MSMLSANICLKFSTCTLTPTARCPRLANLLQSWTSSGRKTSTQFASPGPLLIGRMLSCNPWRITYCTQSRLVSLSRSWGCPFEMVPKSTCTYMYLQRILFQSTNSYTNTWTIYIYIYTLCLRLAIPVETSAMMFKIGIEQCKLYMPGQCT